jgi:uncharacterized protein
MAPAKGEGMMRNVQRFAAIIGVGFTLTPAISLGQAITVQPSGQIVQETPAASTIPPEDQASKEQLAKLFEVMRIREQVQSVRKMVPLMVEGQIQQQSKAIESQMSRTKMTPEQRTAVEQITRKYVDKAVNIYPVEEMVDDMTSIYQRYLSRDDVDGMIAFYSSQAGQHLLDAQPKIAQEYMPLVMKRVAERTKGLTAEMMKETEELTRPSQSAPAQK